MTQKNPIAPPGARPVGRSLSSKLLVLTILFVMIAEVLIYVPSIANYRNMWLQQRIDAAAIATLAAQGGGPELSGDLERALLRATGVEAIALRAPDRRVLIASRDLPDAVVATHDLTMLRPLDSVRAAFATLVSAGDDLVMAVGRPQGGDSLLEVVVAERSLRDALLLYSRNVLLLSLAISAITAALVFLALKLLIVRPIARLSDDIVRFSEAPEEQARIIRPSGRRDEIGVVEERLAAMQAAIRDMLAERRRLADLGLAVSKINHDLRNILASAQLFSDRLVSLDDPLARRFAPKIVSAIDRAILYTRSVLDYGRAKEVAPERRHVMLRNLVADVADVLALPGSGIEFDNRVPPEIEADADPDQLFRVVMNLMRNAVDALSLSPDPHVARRVFVEAERQGSVTVVRVGDTGPGVPERARASLFQPFRGSARPGGTGLGLAIAAELVRAHGGEIALKERRDAGALFEFSIPDRPVDLGSRRRARSS